MVLADFFETAGAWEEVVVWVILVEGESADSVGVVEGLLHAVAVVDVDVWSLGFGLYGYEYG